jgi:hypothetical protein
MIPFLEKKPEKVDPGTQAAIGLGYQMLAAMGFFVGGGYYLDRRYDSEHTFTLLGVGLAFVYSGYEVWKLVRLMNREDQPPKPPADAPR